MNFFEHQDRARKRSNLLVFLYALAVLLIMAGIYLVIIGVFNMAISSENEEFDPILWNPIVFGWVIGITAIIILSGTFYKIAQLKAGGAVVARMLGGRRITPNSQDPLERKILNIVEEMAIASGVPVPEVYILDEEISINAFAAGFSQNDAVVAVTRGCAERLNRDELQGVIAHEFSHIFNGDMRLNIKLMGILHGIIVLSLVGYWMLRIGLRSGGRSSRGKKGNVGLIIALVGLLTMIIGYIGVFFASLIKSAVSRQREFLADASAVQFTRNPGGIGNALKKIAEIGAGSRIQSPNAEQASHMFFANGLRESFIGLFATHPPLVERIKRIEGYAPSVAPSAAITPPPIPDIDAGMAPQMTATAVVSGLTADTVIASVGNPQKEHLDYAENMIRTIPNDVLDAVRDVNGAQAVVFSLLMDNKDVDIYARQRELIKNKSNEIVSSFFEKIDPLVAKLDRSYRIVLADMAFATLKGMTVLEFRAFSALLKELSEMDMTIDLFEYTLQHMVKRRIARALGLTKKISAKGGINDYIQPIISVISCLAHWGQMQTEYAQAAFRKGITLFPFGANAELVSRDSCGLAGLEESLTALEYAPPSVKQLLVKACVETIFADKQVTVEEAEMLRAIVEALDCPVPPIFAGTTVSQN